METVTGICKGESDGVLDRNRDRMVVVMGTRMKSDIEPGVYE